MSRIINSLRRVLEATAERDEQKEQYGLHWAEVSRHWNEKVAEAEDAFEIELLTLIDSRIAVSGDPNMC